MLSALAVDKVFLSQSWRRAPALLRGKAAGLALSRNWRADFGLLCRSEAKCRMFFNSGISRSEAREASDARLAYELFEEILTQGYVATLLLNGVERVDDILSTLHDSFAVRQNWRKGDIVATLSAAGSGIGYHAGSEDGFIVQLHGTRQWKVWGPEFVETAYRNYVLGLPVAPEMVKCPSAPPWLEVELQPGDVLYLPPLFGHEGVTIEQSVSLSVGWRGFTPYSVLSTVLQRAGAPGLLQWAELSGSERQKYSTLLPDPCEGSTSDDASQAVYTALRMVGANNAFRTVVERGLGKSR